MGGGKIEVMLYLKTKNREDQKKGRQKNLGGVKNYLVGEGKKILGPQKVF